MARLKLFIPLLVFVVLALIFLQVLNTEDYNPQDLPSALIGQPLPSFHLAQLDQAAMITDQDLIGEVFLLNVWATWCISCRVEHPYLNELKTQGINIVGLDYKDDQAKALAWLQKLGNPYRINLFDKDGKLGLDLGVYGAPETYLVDAKGIIQYKYVGVVDDRVWQDEIKPLYDKLLK